MSIIESFIYFKFYFRQKTIFNYDIPVLGYTMINSVFDFTYNLCISYKMYILERIYTCIYYYTVMSIIESFIYFKFYFRQKTIFNYDIPVLGYTMINSVFDFTYNLCISYKMVCILFL
ncbi:hypothetical protein Glove_267g90 [Diversispora epigaea]|uniref:Uncharacterized protein n=1 Tax=Diversispora epigaea TaxID=1348612 RepID=A0A397I541_9GLOM|nr:hypothetical protein Glove_267g90 [Diversispora epigaea]